MLTYSGFAHLAQWRRFLASLTDTQLQTWGVKHWCATLERLPCYASRAPVHLCMCVRMCTCVCTYVCPCLCAQVCVCTRVADAYQC